MVVDGVLPIGSVASIVGYDGGMNIGTLSDMNPDALNETFLLESLPTPPAWKFNLAAGSPDPDTASVLRYDRFGPTSFKPCKPPTTSSSWDVGRSISQIILPILQRADFLLPLWSVPI